MRRSVFITVTGTLATVLGALIIAQSDSGRAAKPPPVPLLYNPYPPGILPADLDSEIARVRREVNFIFQQALADWRALPPPNLTGQPPKLQGSGYQMVQTLGKLMNFDETISPFQNIACAPATCRTRALADRSHPST